MSCTVGMLAPTGCTGTTYGGMVGVMVSDGLTGPVLETLDEWRIGKTAVVEIIVGVALHT